MEQPVLLLRISAWKTIWRRLSALQKANKLNDENDKKYSKIRKLQFNLTPNLKIIKPVKFVFDT